MSLSARRAGRTPLRATLAITDPEGNTVMQSYFDDSHSSPGNTVGASDAGSGSLNSRISQFIAGRWRGAG